MNKLSITEDKLEEIIASLDKISKALILKPMLEYKESIRKKIDDLVDSDILTEVWNACDGSLNISEIAKKLGKTKATVSVQIKPWIDGKIAFEILRDNSKYPISIDAIINSIILSCMK